MISRKVAAVMLVLAVLLSGCVEKDAEGTRGIDAAGVHTEGNGNIEDDAGGSQAAGETQADSLLPEENKDAPDLPSGEFHGNGGTDAAGIDAGNSAVGAVSEEVHAGDENGTGVIELIPMKELPELNMDPQVPFTIEEIAGIGGTSMLTPVYYENVRYWIREFTRNPSKLVIDIGNTGSETIVIDDSNIEFSILDDEGNNIAGSKVQGAPVSISPGEIKRVVVTARNPDAGYVHFEFGGAVGGFSCPVFRPFANEASDITDTKPYNKYGQVWEYENEGTFISAETFRQVIGNGKLKAMSRALMVVENDRIGPIDRGDGFLALVKVRIANTSDEPLMISRLYVAAGGAFLDYTEKDMTVLGDMALPFTAEPNSIIEGWVPFRVTEGREAYGVVFYTNQGNFIIDHLQTYPVHPDH
jgi:hypothetical protein